MEQKKWKDYLAVVSLLVSIAKDVVIILIELVSILSR